MWGLGSGGEKCVQNQCTVSILQTNSHKELLKYRTEKRSACSKDK